MQLHLTVTRLNALEVFFQATSARDLYGCYAWTQAVGAALLPILGDLEVTLRNAIHRGLSQYYGGADSFEWMLKTRPNPSSPADPTSWHKLNSHTQKDVLGASEKVRQRKGKGNVTLDDIVAKVAFGFWDTIIKGLTHKSHPVGMQARVLAVAFPNAPDLLTTGYGDRAFVVRMGDLLYQMRDVRNRIGHHDSIWKIAEFDAHGRRGFVPRRPRHTVNSLRLLADQIVWLVGWIDPKISLYIKESRHWWYLQSLLTKDTLTAFRRGGGRGDIYTPITGKVPGYKNQVRVKKRAATHDAVLRIIKRSQAKSFFY